MLPKPMLHAALSQVTSGCFSVHYWDGKTECYGHGTPQFTIHVRDAGVLNLLDAGLEKGFSEAYANGRIDVDGDLADVIATALQNVDIARKGLLGKIVRATSILPKRRSLKKQKEEVARHYDLGNDFFRLFLDPSMTYSCAYFQSPDEALEDAQRGKLDLCLRKLRLQPGQTLLDIGCGWGSAIIRAAGKYGARATGITLSEEQAAGGREFIRREGLEDKAEVRLLSYLELAGEGRTFDKILSIGMIEHVGKAHLADFAECVAHLLAPGGLALLHHITAPDNAPADTPADDSFRARIFPGTYVPTLPEMLGHLTDNGLRILNIENLREHYRMTLDRWSESYESHLDEVRDRFGDEFVRLWRLYLRGSSACFRVGSIEVHQILVSKGVARDVPLTMEDVYA